MKKVVLFDMDGTLMYTLDDLTNSVNHALESLGYESRSVKEVEGYVGNGIKKLVERALPDNKEKLEEAYKITIDHYHLHAMDESKPYEGAVNVLKKLREIDIKIGIVTNKNQSAAEAITAKYFDNLIDVVIGVKKFRKLKPDADPVHLALKKLKVNNYEALYVGDSEVDLQTANNAGIDFIGAAWGYKEEKFLRENGASQVIKDISEIFNIL